jgi:MoaA/NifB/PqqE/SkfB family radical SAM enzyme
LEAILAEDLHTTVHFTINQDNLAGMAQIIEKCKDLGANAMSLSTSDPSIPELEQALSEAQTMVAEAELPLKWDLPVPYSDHNPISLELKQEEIPSHGAGKAWYYVEPDGDLLPSQGVNEVLGNLLSGNWTDFWS